MNLAAGYEVALGARARVSDVEWKVGDPESARLAVAIALAARAPLSAGHPQPGRTGLRPPSGVVQLWPGELVARVGAGTTVSEIEAILQPHGLALGLEVARPERTTLGACFADGRSGFAGPRGINLRDRCIGLSFVDGRARLLAAGSRVVKNVAGYDFGRLHHGARGSLGMVLDLTLRLIARPAQRVAVWWACEREDLPRRLPELREAWGQDAWCEICVDWVSAVRFGLPGAGIVFRQAGDPDLIAARIERTNAADVSHCWDSLLVAAARPGIAHPVSSLARGEYPKGWVAELGYGILRGGADPHTGGAAPSSAALSVKQVFDPHGIWPALPGQEVQAG